MKIIALLVFPLWSACSSELMVSSTENSKPRIDALDAVEAAPGDTVTVQGKNLDRGIQVKLEGKELSLSPSSSSTASFVIPSDVPEGIMTVTFEWKGKNVLTASLIHSRSVEALMPSSLPVETVCDSVIIKNRLGKVMRGKAPCSKDLLPCSQNGQTGCLTTASLRAGSKSRLNPDVCAP